MNKAQSMWTELKTLLWLQWKLTRSMFRSRRKSDVMRIVGLLLRILSLLFTLPMFVVMGIGVAVGLILLSPRAAYEAVVILNTGLFFIWLLMPSSASSQMVERFEMSRLFPHPISFRSIVVGSTLMATLTMTGMWTIPLLAGEIVGLAYHQPLALPMIVVGALPAFAVLALTGRIMDDVFDLVAGDRRLRALAITLFSLPFMLCWLVQYALQNLDLSNTPIQPLVSQLEKASGPSEFLEMLNLSRFLMWLPPAWPAAGMGLTARGEWGLAILFLGLSVAGVALLLLGHARITRRLMEGAALSIGVERVRSREWRVRLPGPPAFWALFKKDWLYLWRSPVPRRLIFSSLIMTVAMVLPMRNIGQSDAPSVVRGALPILIGASAITMASMAINMGLASNYFGVIDREGFTTLALSPTDRRYALLSANLAALLYTSAQVLVISLAFSILAGRWEVLPLGIYLGICLEIGGLPAYTLAAIIGPYRTQLKFTRGTRQRGNLWGILAWVISAPLVLATLLPYVIWKPLLMLTLPLGIVFVLGIYALTLKPLARLLQRREHTILEAITTQE
jgi:hypothetical protein